MVSGGQLAFLSDPVLVNRLANLYEHFNVRIEYNGSNYDDAIWDVTGIRSSFVWDPLDRRFLISDATEIRAFRTQIVTLRGWNRFYSNLLGDWQEELRRVMVEVESYLERVEQRT